MRADESKIRRAIVTVAVGKRENVGKPNEETIVGKPFAAMLDRWQASFEEYGEAVGIRAFTKIGPRCPTHLENPYAFKAYAIEDVIETGYTSILWTDVSVAAIRSLAPLWERTERDGYWFSDNGSWNCGQWTCDAALPLLGITRQDAFSIPQVAATAFALDFTKPIAVKFFEDYREKAMNGAFVGPWVNNHGEASSDPRVLGHRHDQTAASIAVWRLGMETTKQPAFITDYRGETPETILKVER